jgi:hypothetical protein
MGPLLWELLHQRVGLAGLGRQQATHAGHCHPLHWASVETDARLRARLHWGHSESPSWWAHILFTGPSASLVLLNLYAKIHICISNYITQSGSSKWSPVRSSESHLNPTDGCNRSSVLGGKTCHFIICPTVSLFPVAAGGTWGQSGSASWVNVSHQPTGVLRTSTHLCTCVHVHGEPHTPGSLALGIPGPACHLKVKRSPSDPWTFPLPWDLAGNRPAVIT